MFTLRFIGEHVLVWLVCSRFNSCFFDADHELTVMLLYPELSRGRDDLTGHCISKEVKRIFSKMSV